MKHLFFEYIKYEYFFDLNIRNDPSYYLPINMIFLIYCLLLKAIHWLLNGLYKQMFFRTTQVVPPDLTVE
ncbi:hypothetical protein D3C75_1056960 [compost metagenome]